MAMVKALLEDPKVAAIFSEFKNFDTRGYPFMSLRFFDGVMILEFYENIIYKPNLPTIMGSVSNIENNIKKLLYILRKLEK